jgi:hypothetical protein
MDQEARRMIRIVRRLSATLVLAKRHMLHVRSRSNARKLGLDHQAWTEGSTARARPAPAAAFVRTSGGHRLLMRFLGMAKSR